MRGSVLRVIPVIWVLFVVAACSQGVHRVDSSGYGYAARGDLRLEEVRPVIERAATGRGWELSDVRADGYTARREWSGGKHSIVIGVSYTPKIFSIDYKDSKLLGYTGTSIHHSYNDFVDELEAAIKVAVSGL